jgi:hypothetical protein
MKAHREFLPNFSVVIGHDVARIGIDSDQACQFNFYSGFFPNLTYCSLGDGFTEVHASAGKCPEVVVDFVDQQDVSSWVSNGCSHGRHEAVGLRCLWIMVVVHSPHGFQHGSRWGRSSLTRCAEGPDVVERSHVVVPQSSSRDTSQMQNGRLASRSSERMTVDQ